MSQRQLSVLYHVLLVALCTHMIVLGFSLRGLANDLFIIDGVLVLLLALFQFRKVREDIFVGVFLSVLLLVYYGGIRCFAAVIYSPVKTFEEAEKVSLLAQNSPEKFPIFNSSFVIFFLLTFFFCAVSFSYYRRYLKKRPKFSLPYPGLMYFNPFLSWTRLFFFCTGLFLAAVIFASNFHGYQGALSNESTFWMLLLTSLFFGCLFSRKYRFITAVMLISAQLLIYISIAQEDFLFFEWRSAFDGFLDTLSAQEKFQLQVGVMHVDPSFFVFPEFQGNMMQLLLPEEAPDPLTWKDFILVVPVVLYYLANIIVEPQLKDTKAEKAD